MDKINLIDLQKRKLEKCYLSVTIFTEDIKTRNEGCFCIRKLFVFLGIDINPKAVKLKSVKKVVL